MSPLRYRRSKPKWNFLEQAGEVEWAQSVAGALHHVLDRYVRSLARPARPTEDVTYGASV